ncbi:MAG: TIR domain-containing protein [Planctomycetota bacterium]|nr:TIR domain-containing protein [Planctomycetota bacterium]
MSYSHKDVALVHPELIWMQAAGFNVWYDEGIEAGTEWTEALAGAIEGATLFIYFVTPVSVESQNCRNEVNFAIDHGVDIIPIHLVETALPGGLSLTLSSRQAIHKHEMAETDYRQKVEARIASFLHREEVEGPAVTPPPVKRSWVRRHKVITTMGVLLLALVGGAIAVVVPALPRELSVAVLPFDAAEGDADMQRIARSLSDEVLTSLAAPANSAAGPSGTIVGTRVIPIVTSRAASMQFANSNLPLDEIGARLDATYLIEGSVRRANDAARVTVQMLRPASGKQVWTRTYDVDFDGQFASSVAEHIAHMATNLMVIEDYRQALDLLHQLVVWTGLDWFKAREQFVAATLEYVAIRLGEGGGDWRIYEQRLKRTVELAPDFAYAHLLLANAYQQRLGGLIAYSEAAPKARAALDQFIRHTTEEGRTTHQLFQWFIGQINVDLDLDYAAADERLRRAIELDASTIWPRVFLASVELREGRVPEALRLLKTAADKAERDVQSAIFQLSYAGVLNILGETGQALEINEIGLNQTMEGPDRSRLLRQRAHLLLDSGREQEARPLIDESWVIDGGVRPDAFVALFARLNDRERADELLGRVELDYDTAENLALGFLYLGDVNKTFAALELAILNRSGSTIDGLRRASWWDPIREDPRFGTLLALLESMEIHTKRYEAQQDLRGAE